MLSEQAEEILEALWIQTEEEGKKPLALGASRDEPAVDELVKLGYIRKDTGHIYLLEKGRSQATACVRRHRLAERLLAVVLDVKTDIIDTVSCKFEHLLHEGLEDNVCMLLGHPKICPHGKSIPPGKCCRKRADGKQPKFIAALIDMKVHDKGKIAYLQVKDTPQMQKLIGIGAIPGISISLLQKFPSYVFQIGQSQFAVDKELAGAIYVRLTK